MTAKPTVAIIGATGLLGKPIAKAFLSPPFRDSFAHVRLLSRSAEPLAELTDLGATWVQFEGAEEGGKGLKTALKGVDVLICALGSQPAAKKFRDAALLPALAASPSVSLYLPSEFGADHTSRFHDFAHPEWDAKKVHRRLAAQLLAQATRPPKICAVYAGLVLELSVGPWFGYDEGVYEAVGSADYGVSFTSEGDLGRAVAALAAMEVDKVPEVVRLAGDTKSMREIAGIMGKAGAGEIEIREIDFAKYKKWALENQKNDPARPLRFLMGQGGLRHEDGDGGLGNDDELVNPGGRIWTWKTVDDFARETGGKPWL